MTQTREESGATTELLIRVYADTGLRRWTVGGAPRIQCTLGVQSTHHYQRALPHSLASTYVYSVTLQGISSRTVSLVYPHPRFITEILFPRL